MGQSTQKRVLTVLGRLLFNPKPRRIAMVKNGKSVFLWSTLILCALALVAQPVPAAEKSIKVGAYGGYFKDSFDKHIFPDFTKETGIAVESVAEPTGEAWLVQLEQAAKTGVAPADVNMIAQTPMLRGQKTQLWQILDLNKIPNSKNVLPVLIHKYPDGKVDGIGAVSWYITLVSNTKVFPEAPKSWGDMWQPDKKDKLGLLALASNSFLLEITATTYFGGTKILDTQEGIQKVLDKLATIKPNVKLWYRDEAQFEQALKSGEIPMGQYYHDVATLAGKDGFPVRSTFPKEGGVLDSGIWAVTKACKKIEEAEIFINYMSRPDIQAKLARKVGTAPTVRRNLMDLTPAEFAAVSSEITPIIPRYDIYTGNLSDWINQKWTEMITR
jgi:putative spermidine/putrescine transport system substrate-binding protein